MKIAVSSSGNDLSSEVDPRFGRAANFIIVDSETMAFEVVENKQNLNMPQGAGIQAGKIVADSGAKVVLTGNCGPKAFAVLNEVGAEIVVGVQGTVIDAVNAYKNGELKATDNPNVDGHWM